MKLIPLGTNGFFSSFNRQTACYVVPLGKTLIILDAGSGLFRFSEPQGKALLRGVSNIHLYLSHYHLDHTFGFYAAFKLFEGKKVTVFGSHQKQVFSEFVKLKHFPIDYSTTHKNFSWKTVRVGSQQISNYQVVVRKQHHRGEGSLAFRFSFPNNKDLAYVTDSEPSEESIKFVRNVDLLLHEHEKSSEKELKNKSPKLKDCYDDGHVTVIGAAMIAKEAKSSKLALIHHHPFVSSKDLEKQLKIARSIFPKTYLACDLEEIQF